MHRCFHGGVVLECDETTARIDQDDVVNDLIGKWHWWRNGLAESGIVTH